MTPDELDKAVADMRKVLPSVVAEIERRAAEAATGAKPDLRAALERLRAKRRTFNGDLYVPLGDAQIEMETLAAATGAKPDLLNGFDNETEACRHCPTPEVHPRRGSGYLTYEQTDEAATEAKPDLLDPTTRGGEEPETMEAIARAKPDLLDVKRIAEALHNGGQHRAGPAFDCTMQDGTRFCDHKAQWIVEADASLAVSKEERP